MRFALLMAFGLTLSTPLGILAPVAHDDHHENWSWKKTQRSPNVINIPHRRRAHRKHHHQVHAGYPHRIHFDHHRHRGYHHQSTSGERQRHHYHRHRLSDRYINLYDGDGDHDDHISSVKVYRLRDLVNERPYRFHHDYQYPVENYISSKVLEHPLVEQSPSWDANHLIEQLIPHDATNGLVSRLFSSAKNKFGRRKRRHRSRRANLHRNLGLLTKKFTPKHKFAIISIPTEIQQKVQTTPATNNTTETTPAPPQTQTSAVPPVEIPTPSSSTS